MNLLITGRPGAGKGTQAANIVKYYNIIHISTGDMFREAISNKTETGLLAKSYMDKGELVPDSVTNEIVKERLSKDDCKSGFLLDGYPRTLAQAKELDKILTSLNLKLDAVLDISVDEDILVERMCGRRICPTCSNTYHVLFNKPKKEGICDNCNTPLIQRKDDTKETAINRLKVYEDNTKPLLDYYNDLGLLKVVDGKKDVDTVFKSIINTLGDK